MEFYRNFPNRRRTPTAKITSTTSTTTKEAGTLRTRRKSLSGMRSITPLAIRASEILGVDAEIAGVWHEFLANMALLPTNERRQETPAGRTGDLGGHGSSQRKGAHVPGCRRPATYETTTVSTADAEMVKIAKRLRGRQRAHEREEPPVPTLSAQGVEAANLGRADHVRWFLPNQIRRLAPQSDNCDFVGDGKTGVLANRLGLREGPGDLECQRLGTVAQAMHAALLQSAPPVPGGDPVIHVFPAWPKDWDAEYTLLARGAFVVTAAMRRGEIEFVEVKSQAGEKCRLANPWPSKDVTLYRNGKAGSDLSGALLEFDTAQGEVVVAAPKGTAPAALKRAVAV